MGVGMTVVVSKRDACHAAAILRENGVAAYRLGEIVRGDEGVILW